MEVGDCPTVRLVKGLYVVSEGRLSVMERCATLLSGTCEA